MSRPGTAREALLAEALGDVAQLLDRVESLSGSMEVGRIALVNANTDLGERLKAFEAAMASITQQVKVRAVEHILRQTSNAAGSAIETQTQAMRAAARQVFSAEVDSGLARATNTLRQSILGMSRPWELWATHAATAMASAGLTWTLMSIFGGR